MVTSKMTKEEAKEYESLLRKYEDYKQLRTRLGKPPKAFDDKKAILKDLLGEGLTRRQFIL